jgi:hypothetical protein
MDKEYFKSYYILHKNELKTKIKCDVCGGNYTKTSKCKHVKTRKHIDSIKIKELENVIKEKQA